MKNSTVVPQNIKIELPYDPLTYSCILFTKELKIESQRDICTFMFIAALFTITKMWKQPKYPSWMNRLNVVFTYKKYYSALKRKEILLYATTRMNHGDVMLSEISQSQKDKYCMILLI